MIQNLEYHQFFDKEPQNHLTGPPWREHRHLLPIQVYTMILKTYPQMLLTYNKYLHHEYGLLVEELLKDLPLKSCQRNSFLYERIIARYQLYRLIRQTEVKSMCIRR